MPPRRPRRCQLRAQRHLLAAEAREVQAQEESCRRLEARLRARSRALRRLPEEAGQRRGRALKGLRSDTGRRAGLGGPGLSRQPSGPAPHRLREPLHPLLPGSALALHVPRRNAWRDPGLWDSRLRIPSQGRG